MRQASAPELTPPEQEASAPDARPEESAPVDEAGARLEVAARIRDILQDVERLVEPVDERLREQAASDEEEGADSEEELDDEERSDEDDGAAEEDASDDAESADGGSDSENAPAAEEDSDAEERSDTEHDSDAEEDSAAAVASKADSAEEEDSAAAVDSDDAEDAGNAGAVSANSAQPSREPTPRPKPAAPVENTIIVQTVSGLPLHVQLDTGDPVRISKDRFIIGRGVDCDLMVKSARVSREHAAVVREGAEFFIEDLESSNGTWFDDTRITRRLISDGEEYLLGGIRVTFTLR
ncbi:FHA domain-containing protein [Pyxidicoccus sp. 3LFB2]